MDSDFNDDYDADAVADGADQERKAAREISELYAPGATATHLYNGECPDGDDPEDRDPECPACAELDEMSVGDRPGEGERHGTGVCVTAGAWSRAAWMAGARDEEAPHPVDRGRVAPRRSRQRAP